MSRLLLELAHLMRFGPRRLQNKLLVASWNAQRRSGNGPWEVI